MKKVIVCLIILVTIGIIVVGKFLPYQHRVTPRMSVKSPPTLPLPSPSQSVLFVPYWTLQGNVIPSTYTAAAYFGITANMSGVDTTGDGYKDIGEFVKDVSPHQRTLLVIQLEDQDIDEKLLHSVTFSKKVINQSVAIAKQYHFDGVIVDLEYKALPFEEVVQGVSNFSTSFSKNAHNNHLLYYQALFGDTFYRLRPFDVAAIGRVSDGIFVMAYDFHKANGDPGPNFPLNELSDENYSFGQMISDFGSKVNSAKITVVFGFFGYDWTVDEKGQSIGEAESLTTNQMLQKFLIHCMFAQCTVQQDKASEVEVTYMDMKNQKHIVWFEDKTSEEYKKRLLTAKGINSIAFWAWGYF